jgi:hypothetical protein
MKIINSAIENHPDNKHEVFQPSNVYDYGAVLSSIKAADKVGKNENDKT